MPVQRLTFYEREQLELMTRQQLGVREIGRRLARDHSVISRELRRNCGPFFPYTAQVAQAASDRKQRRRTKCKLDKYLLLRRHIEAELQKGQSPDGIAGRLTTEPLPELHGLRVSHETIYAYIQQHEAMTEYSGIRWYRFLFRGKPKRQKQGGRKWSGNTIPERISIHGRPEEINTREDYGHWESDTVCGGRRQAAVSVQSERKSKLLRLTKLANHTAAETEEALRASIESLPSWLWQSITFDNGGEGACHITIRDEYQLDTYFCDPYASWQKGGVEQANGLLRRYLPKKMDLTNLSEYDLFLIQERLNNKYRKSLHYQTPNEIIGTLINQRGALDS
jgi:IS30 family transposase